MAMHHRSTVTKTLIGVAFITGLWVGTAPASAEPSPAGTSDPFGALHCGACHETTGHGVPEVVIQEGIRQALAG
jgi:hypothetical protein